MLIHSMQVNSFRSANFTSDNYNMYGYMYGKYCFVILQRCILCCLQVLCEYILMHMYFATCKIVKVLLKMFLLISSIYALKNVGCHFNELSKYYHFTRINALTIPITFA